MAWMWVAPKKANRSAALDNGWWALVHQLWNHRPSHRLGRRRSQCTAIVAARAPTIG
jgi:hypothetical protein